MRSRRLVIVAVLIVLLGLVVLPVAGQDYRARVQGNVTDQSQAAVVGAKVTLKNTGTGVENSRQTDGTGHYIFDYVPPGTYTVSVEMAGFNKFSQEGIVVQTRGDVTVNGQLSVGGVAETVNVVGETVALETNTTTMAQTVTGKMLSDLPILARNPFSLVLLDPAVVNRYWDVSHRNPFYMQAANGVDLGGNTGGRNDLLLDGVPIGVDSRGSYAPSMDAVQEVSIQQNSVDAEFGFSAGGNMSVSMKSGTNEYHGTGYYFGRNPALNAMANRYTRSKNVVKQHMWGGTVGGPIVKNKLFTFFSYEKWKATQPSSGVRTLPTDLERTGDFSQSKNGVGGLRTIYDPWSTKFDAATSTATRTPFAGNVIPGTRIDPSSKIIMNDIWKPNGPGDDITGINNYKITYPWWTNYYNISDRTDWNINDKVRMYARYSYFRTRLDNQNYANSPAVPSDNGGLMDTMNAAADGVYTMNPTTVLNFRFGTTYLEDDYDSEWAKVGEAGLQKIWGSNTWYKPYIEGIPAIYYPSTQISGKAGFGKGSTWFYRPRKYSMSATGAKDYGRHYMKTGLAFRYSYGTSLNPNLMNNYFYPTHTANTFISPNTNLSGDAWATFLLGAVDNNSTAQFITPQNIIRKQWGIFFQDDFKLNKRITLNLGLRYEYETAPVEELDRMSRYLDLTNPIPEMQGSGAPVMPAEVTAIRTAPPSYTGAWVYTDSGTRKLYNAPKNIFLPRAGIAFKINDKTVLRVGYARYSIPMVNAIGSSWYIPADGYNATSNPLPPVEGIPKAILSDPYPAASNPLIPSAGKKWGRYTHLGEAGTWFTQDMKIGMNDRINVTVQREISYGIRTDATYFYSYNHNYQPPNIWGGTGAGLVKNMTDPNLSYQYKGALDQRVANPFYNYMTRDTFPGSLRNQPTVTVGSLLSPRPQYAGLTQLFRPGLSNRYQALQLKAERSFSLGFSFMLGYNYNRETSTEFFNSPDQYLDKLTWIGSNNPRHRISGATSIDIPVGKGRKYLNNIHPVMNAIIGGWSTSHMYLWNSGPPLRWGQLNVSGDPKLDNPTGDLWFNTKAFAIATPYTPRTNPWQYDGLNGPGYWSWDSTFVKYFPITERIKLEFRFETYNTLNTLMLVQPNQTVTSSQFGKSVGQANYGREAQYTARIHF